MDSHDGVPLVWLVRRPHRELVVLDPCLVLKEPAWTYATVPASGEPARVRAIPLSRRRGRASVSGAGAA